MALLKRTDVRPGETTAMNRKRLTAALLGLAVAGSAMAACTPTIRLQVDPIQIYAKLDADVRVRLDRELQDLLVENPNLF
jgi:hypothetical protein